MANTSIPSPQLDPAGKGLGVFPAGKASDQAAGLGWNLLAEDVSLPAAVLYENRVQHNLEWMRQFLTAYQVKLAPHGKTTMSPRLFHMQLEHGAWGITLATAPQTKAAHLHGVRRVLMANQLVGKANMAIIAELLRDPDFSFCCLVDSVAGVRQLGEFFAARGEVLPVLTELGPQGGRTGVRDDAALEAVLDELARWPQSLALAGVEIYEGVLKEEDEIRAFLRRAVATLRELAQAGRLRANAPAILTGAGSAWYDVVLRPGCYLTHDVGAYRAAAERIAHNNPVARKMASSLQPALQIWAYVQSIPEPGRAIIALGKRDAAFDAGMPVPDMHYRPSRDAGGKPGKAASNWQVTAMMDQHAFMQIAPGDDLEVGDMISFDVCHPCLTFDKWRQVLLLDERYDVTGVAETYF